MVEGGSEKAFAQWLAERPQSFCEKVEAVAMDAFAGYKKAAARQVPHAVEILDPFHIVKLAGDKVTAVRCRLQREATGRRGTRTDPLYRGRRILLKTASLRTDRQKKRADELLGCFASMFVRQVRQCFSAVWADGFPRCRHRFPVM